MKRNVVEIKLLLLVPALLLGMTLFAQKNVSGWMLENEILQVFNSNPPSAQQSAGLPASFNLQGLSLEQAAINEKQKMANMQKTQTPYPNSAGVIAQPGTAPENNPNNIPTDNVWSILFHFCVLSPVFYSFSAVESDGTYVYEFNWNQNLIYKTTTTGTLIQFFSLSNWTSSYGIYSITHDGFFYYAVDGNSSNIYKINLQTQAVVGTIPTAVSDLTTIGYDPTANGGNGGFWIGGWMDIHLVSKTGVTLYTIPSAAITPYLSWIEGCAFDQCSAGGPYMWFSASDNLVTYQLHQFSLATHLFTGLVHNTYDVPEYSAFTAQIGSCTTSTTLIPGKEILLGCLQGGCTNDSYTPVFAYELCFLSTGVPCDVGVTQLVTPVSGPVLGATEIVRVQIYNFGTAPQTNIPVWYTFQGGPQMAGMYAGPAIQPQSSVVYTFSQTVDMTKFCTYTFVACTGLACDTIPANDCLNISVTHQLPIVYDTLYPQNIADWTGTTDGNSITQNSLIKITGGNLQNGWAKFDISSLPANANVVSANLRVHSTTPYNDPRFRLTQMLTDPLSQTASQLFNAIKSGISYATDTTASTVGNWLDIPLSKQAYTDLAAQLTPGWFAVGFHEYENNTSKTATFDGHAQAANRPYIAIQYYIALAHDVGIYSVDLPQYIPANQLYQPAATVQNYGSNAEINVTVTITGPGGYNQSLVIASILAGAQVTVNFPAVLIPNAGNACFTVCTSLSTDMNCNNDCLSGCSLVMNNPTEAYAYMTNSPNYPDGPFSFLLDNPNIVTFLAPGSSPTPIRTGAWADGTWYGAEYYDTTGPYNHGHLYTINTVTGVMTDIGFIGVGLSGLTYDHTTGILYGLQCQQVNIGTFHSRIYSINMTTGAASLVHDFGYALGKPGNLACNDAGMLFTFDLLSSRLCAIDPANWSVEFINQLNLPSSNLCEADFDVGNNILYLTPNIPGGELYRWDYLSGTFSHVGPFNSNPQVTGMAIPYNYAQQATDIGVMWITSPSSGNLGTAEAIGVKLRNYGINTVSVFNICYSVNNGLPFCVGPGIGFPILPGQSFSYLFPPNVNMSIPGNYFIKAWVNNCAGDFNQANDTAAKTITNSSCSNFNCFPYSVQEPEVCGQDTNSGCLGSPAHFTNISMGNSYCGTTWKNDTLRDTDWYRFTLLIPQTIRVISKTEFDLELFLVKLPCTLDSIKRQHFISGCKSDTLLYYNLPPGDYALVYAPSFSTFNLPCNPSPYKYSFNFNTTVSLLKTYVPDANLCAGVDSIPVIVLNLPAFNGFNLSLNLPPGLSYHSYTNLNPGLQPQNLSITISGDTLRMNYFSTVASPAIAQGSLLELLLNANPGYHIITWNQNAPGNGYTSMATGFMITFYQDGSYHVEGCGRIQGSVNYDNLPMSALMDSTHASLTPLNPPGATLLQAVDNSGQFLFNGLTPGTYQISAQSTKTWGGNNAVDALKILQHFVGQSPLSGIRLKAADVNASGSVNASDALKVLQRFVGQINSFQAGDWVAENKTINLSGSNSIVQNLKALCYGDVNGSYIPFAKKEAMIDLDIQGEINAVPGQQIDIPVYYSSGGSKNREVTLSNGMIAAMSLVIDVPACFNALDVIPVSRLSGDYFVYKVADNHLRIAWCDPRAVKVQDGEKLFSIRLLVNNPQAENWYLGAESVMADQYAELIPGAGLSIPFVRLIPGEFSLGRNQPNPFDQKTLISYDIPSACLVMLNVYNSLGQLISSLVNKEQTAGSYTVDFDAGQAGAGVYFYRIEARSESKTFSGTKMMVINR